MSANALHSELQRALTRPDRDFLRQVIANFHTCRLHREAGRPEKELPESIFEHPILYDGSDHDRSLALVALAMAATDDSFFLGVVAAGLLEDIFFAGAEVPEEIMARVEAEARRTARFRWMLSGVWTFSFLPEIKARIRQAVGETDMNKDPLPPRPWP